MALSHINEDGEATMVDVSHKPKVKRTAVATGSISLQPGTVKLLREGTLKKGDALACARIAGITAAKKTSDLIPLCHNIFIDQIRIRFKVRDDGVDITATALCVDKTGIEMEALTAVSVAALTIYDMCKAVDTQMEISDVRLVKKTKEPVGKTAS